MVSDYSPALDRLIFILLHKQCIHMSYIIFVVLPTLFPYLHLESCFQYQLILPCLIVVL